LAAQGWQRQHSGGNGCGGGQWGGRAAGRQGGISGSGRAVVVAAARR
jgi:hypothetical protein